MIRFQYETQIIKLIFESREIPKLALVPLRVDLVLHYFEARLSISYWR